MLKKISNIILINKYYIMSGNNAFNKSMNGIVSLDTGGTTIEGETITTDTVECNTINVNTANISSTINTSTIYTDFLVNAANPYITILGGIYTTSINSTTSIDIGSATIPVRSAYVPVLGTDLCNKDYVDAGGGGSLLSSTNVWTGASNTFNNNITAAIVYSSSGDFQNPTATATCRFARNTTSGTVTFANSQTTGTLNIATQAGRTGAINIGASTSTTTMDGILVAGGAGVSACTVWGKATVVFTGGLDYNIVSGDINNVFMVVVNGGNPRTIQMPARKIGQIVIIRSIATTGVSNSISVSLISGGNFYNPGQNTTALFYSLPSGGTVSYFDNGTNWISF
jgi:hypothetical protein